MMNTPYNSMNTITRRVATGLTIAVGGLGLNACGGEVDATQKAPGAYDHAVPAGLTLDTYEATRAQADKMGIDPQTGLYDTELKHVSFVNKNDQAQVDYRGSREDLNALKCGYLVVRAKLYDTEKPTKIVLPGTPGDIWTTEGETGRSCAFGADGFNLGEQANAVLKQADKVVPVAEPSPAS